MSKPTIFFSHSSIDKEPLQRLKQLFLDKTGRSIDVFVSSDGQSIPFGRNWVFEIQEALNRAELMFVFLTPNSVESKWLYFEAGHAYSRGIQVVPVGFLGLDMANVPPPVSLLQGFNIGSDAGLNNLIATTNLHFKHQHGLNFGPQDYVDICGTDSLADNYPLGQFGVYVDEIFITLKQSRDFDSHAGTLIPLLAEYLANESVECASTTDFISSHGVSFRAIQNSSNEKGVISIRVDPKLARVAMPLAESAMRAIRNENNRETRLTIQFVAEISRVTETHKVTGALFRTGVTIVGVDTYRYQDIEFELDNVTRLKRATGIGFESGAALLRTTIYSETIPVDQLVELLDLLFTKRILYISGY